MLTVCYELWYEQWALDFTIFISIWILAILLCRWSYWKSLTWTPFEKKNCYFTPDDHYDFLFPFVGQAKKDPRWEGGGEHVVQFSLLILQKRRKGKRKERCNWCGSSFSCRVDDITATIPPYHHHPKQKEIQDSVSYLDND